MFPGYRRLDVKNWSRWKFYPGALFLMPTRAFLMCLMVLICASTMYIASCCHDFKKGPVSGFRKNLLGGIVGFFSWVLLVITGVWSDFNEIDYDYSEYLGPNYK